MNSYQTIYEALLKIGNGFTLSQPEDVAHGDFATNIAFIVGKEKGVSPKVAAEELAKDLSDQLADIVEKLEVAGPGFINFFLKDDVIRAENKKDEITITTRYAGKKVLVEHSSPNLFKPFSVGHFMNNMIGEFIVRGMKMGGATVTAVSFPSDISLGIAKAVYTIHEHIKSDGGLSHPVFRQPQEEIVAFLGEMYVKGVNDFKNDQTLELKAKEVMDKLCAEKDSEEKQIYTKTKEINITYFTNVLEKFGSHFDGFIYESEAGEVGKKIVEEHTPSVFQKSEGAIVYVPDESRKDINTAVFINSQGNPTYEGKDIGLLDLKFEKYNPDYSFVVTDHEQISHFKVVLDAASRINKAWSDSSVHVPHGRMLFKGQKMSSRLGGVPLALDVIALVEEEVRDRAGEKIAHLHAEEKRELEKEIALSALRIAVLRSKPGININFDPESSLSFEGDSGPYLLYTHARCFSLLEKGKGIELLWGRYEVTPLERKLVHFERILEETINEMAPQKLVAYLFSIAQAFNAYYAQEQIITEVTGENDLAGNAHRLMIVNRTKDVLKNGLYVLGIQAPKRM